MLTRLADTWSLFGKPNSADPRADAPYEFRHLAAHEIHVSACAGTPDKQQEAVPQVAMLMASRAGSDGWVTTA